MEESTRGEKKIMTRRANDRRQKAIETEVEGGARTALVISASQC